MSRWQIIRPWALVVSLAAAPRLAGAQQGLPEPLGRWSFDACEDGFTWDESSTPHHARMLGDAVCGVGRYGAGAVFNGGAATQFEVLGAQTFDTPRFTVAAWVKPNGAGAVVNRWYYPDQWGLWYVGNKFLFGVKFPNGQFGATVAISAPAPQDAWTHVAATYNGSLVALYLDGKQVAAAPASGTPLATDRPIVIGNHPTWEAFEGVIDEVRFYGQDLTPGEVDALATSAPP